MAQSSEEHLIAIAQLAAKLAHRNDLSDEDAVRILLSVSNDMLTYGVQCADCARGIEKDYEQYQLRYEDNLRWGWHDFWCQVAICGLMEIVVLNEQALGFKFSRAGVDEYKL